MGFYAIKQEALTDIQLFEGLLRKDVSSLTALYDRSSPALFGLACKILQDRSLAEDVVQELFIYIWEHADRFNRKRGNPMAWLMVICRNRCIDKLRSSAHRGRSTPIDETALSSVSDEAGDPADEVSQKELAICISNALGQLPEEQRLPIELAYFEGMSQSEIATKLRLPLGTTKTRVRLGMRKLRILMQNFSEKT